MTSERKCEGCRWFEPENRVWPAGCANPQAFQLAVKDVREDSHDCGPAGRYWEPREGQDE